MAWDIGAGMGWWMLFGGLLTIAFWGAIMYVVVSRSSAAPVAGGTPRARRRWRSSSDSARAASLSRDDYERMRRDLAA